MLLATHFLLQYKFSKLIVRQCWSVCVLQSAACVCYGLSSKGYVTKINFSLS